MITQKNAWINLIEIKNKFPIGCKIKHIVTKDEWIVCGYHFIHFIHNGLKLPSKILIKIGEYFVTPDAVTKVNHDII
jgi:hypothetical protein